MFIFRFHKGLKPSELGELHVAQNKYWRNYSIATGNKLMNSCLKFERAQFVMVGGI